jgi:LPS sulfotransferase NodH
MVACWSITVLATILFRLRPQKPSRFSLSELPSEPHSAQREVTSDRETGNEIQRKPEPISENTPAEKFHRYPWYSPRFWHGMKVGVWYKLLRAGRFRIHPSRIPPFIGVSFAAPINSLLTATQRLLFGRRLAAAEFHGPPVFIVGHWRSGTTLLHELMVRDERLSSPSTFQCFVPSHFHVSEWFFRRFAWWLLPGKRPMDNMAAGFDHPQEDEFALLVLGLPSPYRRIAFPNQGPVDLDYLDFDGVPQEDVDRWLAALRKFLLSVSSATGRPLVVKSPTHTGRVAQLAREFPEAKFIHITRNPRELFPSTCRLWHSLDDVQALQKPDGKDIPNYVIECLRRMYKSFHAGRDQIDPHRLIDVKYEDLKRDPVSTLRHIYETLHLGDFESVQPNIEHWVQSEHKEYKPNRHQLAADTEQQIRVAWKDYFEKYGYE